MKTLLIKRILWAFIFSFFIIASNTYAQQTNSQNNANSEFVKLSTKRAEELSKDVPAFMWKGTEYRIRKGLLYYKSYNGKIRAVPYQTVMEMMKDCPESAARYKKGQNLCLLGTFNCLFTAGIIGFPLLGVGVGNQKHAVEDFYNGCLESLAQAKTASPQPNR